MRSFNFNGQSGDENLEQIITARKKKLAKQQIVFSFIVIFLLIILGFYIAQKLIYSEFDGYVQTDYENYKAIDDIYVFDHYKKVGDFVLPGDTLYSYMYLSNILNQENLNQEPGVVIADRTARLQQGVNGSDANVIRVRIQELRKQIAKEDHDIRFGLSDNSHKLDLQRELAVAQEQLKAALSKDNVYRRIGQETRIAMHRTGYNRCKDASSDAVVFRYFYNKYSSAIRYAIAKDSAVVTKLWTTPFSPAFKEDPILQLQPINFQKSNMQVVAYVPTDKMNTVNNNTIADVIVNEDVQFKAKVSLLGVRTEELPKELRNSLSHIYTVVIVVFEPLPNQVMPLWAAVDHVPVRIRIKNLDNGYKGNFTDYWYINGRTVTPNTEKAIQLQIKKQRERRYHYGQNI